MDMMILGEDEENMYFIPANDAELCSEIWRLRKYQSEHTPSICLQTIIDLMLAGF